MPGFLEPAISSAFELGGAFIVVDNGGLRQTSSAKDPITEAGHVDILIVNLILLKPRTSLLEATDELWEEQFEATVHPLHGIVRAALPQMIQRRAGKIVVICSANGLLGRAPRAAYSAARDAQFLYVKSTDFEIAHHNMQINAIAQNFVTIPVHIRKISFRGPGLRRG